MKWESGNRPDVIGDTTLTYVQNGTTYGYSVGLMQIRYLPGRPSKEWLLVPENNIKYASQLYAAHKWQPWTGARHLGLTP